LAASTWSHCDVPPRVVTPPGGMREAVRRTTLTYLNEQQAQVAINSR
jgi:hypothetical protein